MCFEMRNTAIWWRTIYPYLYDVACQASWRRLSSEARGPKARPFVQYPKGLQKAKIWILIYSIPSDEENRIKITRILSINALLSPSLRNVWGFLSGPRGLLHCSNQQLEYYAARGKPLWRHNGFCDVINAQSRQNKRAHP